MINQCEITDKLIFEKDKEGICKQVQHQGVQNRQLRWSCEAGAIGLQIIYPLNLKYGFINQLLHHLVATINKSTLISFLVKIDFDSKSPLMLTFYHTILLPLVQPEHLYQNATQMGKLFTLPDMIYRKILLICEGYTIRHSQFAKAYELIQQITQFSQEITHFIEQIQHICQHMQKDQLNRPQRIDFSFEKNDLCSQSNSF